MTSNHCPYRKLASYVVVAKRNAQRLIPSSTLSAALSMIQASRKLRRQNVSGSACFASRKNEMMSNKTESYRFQPKLRSSVPYQESCMRTTLTILRWVMNYSTQSSKPVLKSSKSPFSPARTKRENFQVRDRRQRQRPVSPRHKPSRHLSQREITQHSFLIGKNFSLKRNLRSGSAYHLKMLNVSYKILLGELNYLSLSFVFFCFWLDLSAEL